jgi:hypothetical protein
MQKVKVFEVEIDKLSNNISYLSELIINNPDYEMTFWNQVSITSHSNWCYSIWVLKPLHKRIWSRIVNKICK